LLLRRLEVAGSFVRRTLRVQEGRLTEAELDDIRARDLLERDAPPLSPRVAAAAWRQAHADRASLLRELEAIRAPAASGVFAGGDEERGGSSR
jgi:hypothetical protein